MRSQRKIKTQLFLLLSIASLSLASCRESMPKKSSSQLANKPTDNVAVNSLETVSLDNKISTGEISLFDPNPNTLKQAAIDAYNYKNYPQAALHWESSLNQQRNDPETLIYLNNARIGDGAAYSIGVPIPISAEINAAKEILRGAAQAQNTINQNGGINGKPIRIVVADDSNNLNLARNIAERYSQNSDILGIVGHFSSDVTLEAAQVYQSQGLVAISPTSTSVAISKAGNYVFRTVSSDCLAGNALAEHLVEQIGVDRAAILYNSASSYSTSLRDVFQASLESKNGSVVAEFNFSEPNFDIVNVLNRAKAKGAKAIALFPNSSGMNALETLDKTFLIALVNDGELPLVGGDSFYKPRTLQLGKENVLDMVISVPWYVKNDNSEFFTTAQKLWGGGVNWRTILAYDATMALAKAIEISPSREGIQQALLAPEFVAQGAEKEIKFLPTGDRAAEVELVKVAAGDKSGFGYDFVSVGTQNSTLAVDMCQSN